MNNKLAFVFPGQGSQSIGMLKELNDDYPIVKQTFDHASEVLDYDLWDLVQQGPEAKLNQTEITQPALLTAGYAVYRVWCEKKGRMPDVLAGHSLGEYTALVCADVVDFPTGVDIVAKRGRYMTEAMQEQQGSMAAIVGLEDQQVIEICQQAAEENILTPANYNSIGQVVIAGHKIAIERALVLANKAGARLATEIAVSVPCHCPLMQPAAKQLALALMNAQFNAPKIPIIHNVDISSYSDPLLIREALVKQLSNPVRWVETIQKLAQMGVTRMVECGPGKVLSGLVKRIDRSINMFSVNDPDSLEKALISTN